MTFNKKPLIVAALLALASTLQAQSNSDLQPITVYGSRFQETIEKALPQTTIITSTEIEKSGLNVQKILTREDAPAKPKPDALLYFSNLWRFDPQECIYVGDYLYDLQAANNAKMHACLYLNEGENLVVMGKSGSGKSVMIKCLIGLEIYLNTSSYFLYIKFTLSKLNYLKIKR